MRNHHKAIMYVICLLSFSSAALSSPLHENSITSSATPGGRITPSTITAEIGQAAIFTISPDSGFELERISGCDGTLVENNYTTAAVSKECQVTASFRLKSSAKPVELVFGLKKFVFTWLAVSGAAYYQLCTGDKDQHTAFKCGDNITGTSALVDIAVHRHDWTNVSYQISACNNAGCTALNKISPTITDAAKSVGYIKDSGNITKGSLSSSLALSGDGNTLAAGSEYDGSVHVYTKEGGTWRFHSYLKEAHFKWYYGYGTALALSHDGRTLAVSADHVPNNLPGITSDQNNHADDMSGAVFVYVRHGEEWIRQAYIKAPYSGKGDNFGIAIALSQDGNTMAVGAPWEDSNATGFNGDESDNSSNNSGAAYVYIRNNSVWSKQAYIKPIDNENSGAFGFSVSLSDDGNTMAVGAIADSTDQHKLNVYARGAAYIFARKHNNWRQQGLLKVTRDVAEDYVGNSVALSADGSTLAVSAPYRAPAITKNQPDENIVAVAVFTRKHNSWGKPVYVTSRHTDAGDWFGNTIALSGDGNLLAIGAYLEDGAGTALVGDEADNSAPDAGAVYLFERNAKGWKQRSYLKAPNTGEDDEFGFTMSMSRDGNTLAVGAHHESSSASGINGDQNNDSEAWSGAVYLY